VIRYVTAAKEASAETVIQKSRFISHIRPVADKAGADGFFAEVREMHKAANHNVPAFVLGEKMEHQWASDDGEPQGTSGTPMLRFFVSEGVTNVAVIVTRYFGGLKLGTGGLARAYTSAAKAALEAAGKVRIMDGVSLEIMMEYPVFERFKPFAARQGLNISDIEYGEAVRFAMVLRSEDKETALSAIRELSSNRADLLSVEDRLIALP